MILNNLIIGFANIFLFLVVRWFGKLIEKGDQKNQLIHLDEHGRKLFGKGLFYGFLSLMLYTLIVIIIGKGKLHFSIKGLKNFIGMFLSGIFAFLGVSLFEETLFRGYILHKLLKVDSENVSILLSSIIFGFFHINAYSSTTFRWLGILNAALMGILLSMIVVKTKSLMLVIGYHLTWNLTQSLLFMQNIYKTPGLFNLEIVEDLWTGNYGTPEAGIAVTITAVLICIYLKKSHYPKKI